MNRNLVACFGIFALVLIMAPIMAHAQLFTQPAPPELSDPGGGPIGGGDPFPPGDSGGGGSIVPCAGPDCTIEDLLQLGFNLFDFLISLVGVLAIGGLVWAGFLYMTAAGEEKKIMQAKQVAMWSLTGLIIALFSVVMIRFILGALGETEGLRDLFSN